MDGRMVERMDGRKDGHKNEQTDERTDERADRREGRTDVIRRGGGGHTASSLALSNRTLRVGLPDAQTGTESVRLTGSWMLSRHVDALSFASSSRRAVQRQLRQTLRCYCDIGSSSSSGSGSSGSGIEGGSGGIRISVLPAPKRGWINAWMVYSRFLLSSTTHVRRAPRDRS